MVHQEQLAKISSGKGFIAALDQSGGSTPKALKQYGVSEDAYSNDDEMFNLVHEMRSRIITAQSFTGDKILGAILFEKTMDNSVEGKPTAQYLWEELNVVPFLKIDKGLADEENGVQIMKPMPELDNLLSRGKDKGIFGTKMRSVINTASAPGIAAVVEQQFEIAKKVISYGMVPIIEPEVNINASDKAEAEDILHAELKKHANALAADQKIMLKLTLPEKANLYADLVAHDNVVLVVALSGGYDLTEACKRLEQNDGMVASFSRALTNDLNADQSDAEFDAALGNAIDKICAASLAGNSTSQAA